MTLLKFIPLALLIACAPPRSLHDRDPLFLVTGTATTPHTVSINSVLQWIKEGRCTGFVYPLQGHGPTTYFFNNGRSIGLYGNTHPELLSAFNKAIVEAPNKIYGASE